VDLTGLADEDLLRWDSGAGKWVPETPQSISLPGLQFLLTADETDSTEHNTSTAESGAHKTYHLAANSYDYIKIEAIVQVRVEQDATTRADFTWRFKEAGSTVTDGTFTQRIIALNTAGADSGNRQLATLSVIIAGGQGSTTALTITSQQTLSNAATGSRVLAFRVYGYKDEALEAVQGPAGPAGSGAIYVVESPAIDLASFSWVNQGSATAAAALSGGANILGYRGASGGTWEYRALVKSAPGVSHHVAMLVMRRRVGVAYHLWGIVSRASGSGTTNIWGPMTNGAWASLYGWSSPAGGTDRTLVNTGADAGAYWGEDQPLIWVHYEDDLTANRRYGWSIDGEPANVAWQYTEGRTTDFTANQIGIGFADYSGTTDGVAQIRAFNIYT